MKRIYNRNMYTKKDAGAAFMLALLAPQFFGSIIVALLMSLTVFSGLGDNILSNPFVLVGLTLVSQLSFLLVYYLYNLAGRFNHKKANKIRFNIGYRNLLLAILIGVVTLFGFQYLVGFVDYLLSLTNYTPSALPLPLDTLPWLFANIVILAVVPAICEELIFRGIIFNGLKQYGVKTAVIGSALLFALIHGNIQQTLYPIIFGVVLAIITLKTNSLIPAIAAHFTNNAIVLTVNYLFSSEGQAVQTSYTPLDYLIVFGSAIVATIAIFILVKLFKTPQKEEPLALTEKEKEKLIERTINNQPIPNEEAWENIITKSNDLMALENAKKGANVHLWIGVAIGLFLWTINLFM